MTIFQKMHFREPVIRARPKFLALTHVLVYGYWCCQVTILSSYDASVMFLLHYSQSIYCHVLMLSVFNNPRQSSFWIVWWKVSQEGIYMYHGNKETKSFDIKCDNSQGMQKMIKKWEEPSFYKYLLAFMNFMITNIKRFAGINFVIAVTFTSSSIL